MNIACLYIVKSAIAAQMLSLVQNSPPAPQKKQLIVQLEEIYKAGPVNDALPPGQNISLQVIIAINIATLDGLNEI